MTTWQWKVILTLCKIILRNPQMLKVSTEESEVLRDVVDCRE